MKYILSIDLGTTSMKAALFNQELKMTAQAQVDYPTEYPRPGYAEHDVSQWWEAFRKAVQILLGGSESPKASDIAVVSIDAMTPTLVAADEHGNALRKSIIWMDRRADSESQLISETLGDRLFQISGNFSDPSNFAPKIRWIKEHEPEIYTRTHRFLSANGWLVHRLTGVFTMDCTQCGLSQLCDTRNSEWSGELIEGSGLNPDQLPPLMESTDIAGQVTQKAASETGLEPGTPVTAGAMDNVAAGLGTGILNHQELYISAGTATNVCLCTGEPEYHPSFLIYRHIVPGRWIQAGGVDYGGAGYKWFAKLIGENDYAALDKRAEQAGSRPLIFLPYMVGQRAPLRNSHTRGVLFGLDPSMDDADLARCFMEGNALGARKILELACGQQNWPVSGRLTGGCARSRVYSQIFADVLGLEIFRVGGTDTAALGSAMAGARAAGFYNSFEEMADAVSVQAPQQPRPSETRYYTDVFGVFDSLYKTLEPSFSRLAALKRCGK